MIRTFLVCGALGIGFWYTVRSPFYSLLFYVWLAYLRPDTWVWSDFLTTLNVSLVVGLLLIGATAFSGSRLRGGLGPALLFGFLAQSVVSSIVSPEADVAFGYLQEFTKTILISYTIVILVDTEDRLRLLLLVMAASLGFEGAKQGWVGLLIHPGVKNINESPMLGDNNGVAVGMLMMVPILAVLARTAVYRIEKYWAWFFFIGVLYRALSTYSRGAFLATGMLVAHFVARAKRKVLVFAAVCAGLVVIGSVLPQEFWDRMATLENVQQGEVTDDSGASRLHFWRVATLMANSRPLVGIGHNTFRVVYDRFDFLEGKYGRQRSVHSIWFGILAETGYPGLIIFAWLFGFGIWSCFRIRAMSKHRPELAQLSLYATAIEGSLIVCAVGGAFVPFQYNEILWHFLALAIVVRQLAQARMAEVDHAERTLQQSALRMRDLPLAAGH